MVSITEVVSPRAPRGLLRRFQGDRVRWTPAAHCLMLSGAGLLLLGAFIVSNGQQVVFAVYAPLVILAGINLSPGYIIVVFAQFLVEILVLSIVRHPDEVAVLAGIAITASMVLMFRMSSSRAELRLPGITAEEMFVDLRDRIREIGAVPALPSGWHAEAAVAAAFGDGFAGDFYVFARRGTALEATLFDVSGKGSQAGNRALALSGAVGGLITAVQGDRLMPAVNDFVLSSQHGDGFATGMHLSLDLISGDVSIGSAGHPPAAIYRGGTGRWVMLAGGGGPALGIIPGAEFPIVRDHLDPGDAIVVYTDGVVETPHRDMSHALDRFLGMADALIPRGFEGGAAQLCCSGQAGDQDDRAVVLIWRD